MITFINKKMCYNRSKLINQRSLLRFRNQNIQEIRVQNSEVESHYGKNLECPTPRQD